MTKDEALKLALEAQQIIASLCADKVIDSKEENILRAAIKQALALDKMAENARELGLDYEPAGGTQVSKVWWDGEKLMAKPIPLKDIYQPAPKCTRSHPHENMDSMCELRTEIARLRNENERVHVENRRLIDRIETIDVPPAAQQDIQRLTALVRAQQITIDKLEQTLAAPVQEPVAWMHVQGNHEDPSLFQLDGDELDRGWKQYPLYTTPHAAQQDIQRLSALVRAQQITIDKLEAQRQWVGLTDEQKCELVEMTDSDPQPHHLRELIDVTEAKLKEKNT